MRYYRHLYYYIDISIFDAYTKIVHKTRWKVRISSYMCTNLFGKLVIIYFIGRTYYTGSIYSEYIHSHSSFSFLYQARKNSLSRR